MKKVTHPLPNEATLAADRCAPELERLVELGRSIPEPEVDWDRVEKGLFARLDEKQDEQLDENAKSSPLLARSSPDALATSSPRLSRPVDPSAVSSPRLSRMSVVPRRVPRKPVRNFGFVAVGTLALAASAVLAVTQPWRNQPGPVAPVLVLHEVSAGSLTALDERTRDGSRLDAGDTITSGGDPLAVGVRRADGGVAVRWTLAPESRVVVRTMAGPDARGQVLALERGAVHADVEHGLGPGSFAVLVEGTRIEVKGTSFRVVRLDGRVEVEVDRGVVGVGPDGKDSQHLLTAPARAAFSFDGARLPDALGHRSEPAWVLALRAPTPERVQEMPAPLPQAPPPKASAKPVERPMLTTAGIRSGLKKCFEQTYTQPADGSVRLSVVTNLTLKLRGEGSVEHAVFDPPLSPEFTQCANGVVFGRFREGTADQSLSLSFP